VENGLTIASYIIGGGGDLFNEISAYVVEPVLELDGLGNGDAVLGYLGGAIRLLNHHVAALMEQHTKWARHK
jgi:hypothetical protein